MRSTQGLRRHGKPGVKPSRSPAHDPGCCRYEHHRPIPCLGVFAAWYDAGQGKLDLKAIK